MGDKAGDYGGGLLNLIPFSDALGITDPEKSIHPSDLTGLKPESSDDWATWGGKHAANLGVGVLTDPLFWATSGLFPAASRGMNALKASGLVNKGTDLAGIMGKTGMGTLNLYQTTKFGDALTELERALPPEQWAKGFQALGEFLTKKGSSIGELTDKPLGGLANLGIFGGGRWPWATVGTGPVAQTIGKGMDVAGSAIRNTLPVRYANALFNQRGTQGMLSKVGQESAPGYTVGEEAAGIAERASANKMYNLVKDVPADARPYLDRLADAKSLPDIAAARAAVANKLNWTPDQIDEYVGMFDAARSQAGTRPMGAAANEWNSPWSNYVSRQAPTGTYAEDVLGGTARRQNGLSTGSQSDISRNLALDMPGGLAQTKDVFRHPLLSRFVESAQARPSGLKEEELAKIMQGLKGSGDSVFSKVPDKYMDQAGWEKFRKMLAPIDPTGSILEGMARNPDDLFIQAEKAGITVKNRMDELAKVYLRATPEGRAAGLFDEPLEQTVGRMTRDQGMRAAHGELLANMLSKKNVLSQEGIVERVRNNGSVEVFRPTTGARPATVGDIATQASLLHGSGQEGFLQHLAKKVGVNSNDAVAMEKLKLSAVSPDVVTDITKWQKRFDAPEAVTGALKLNDLLTSIWKSGVTTRPSFAPRNIMSGNVKLALDQQFSPRAAKVAYNTLRGASLSEGDAKYVLDIPAIKESLTAARINPATATPKQVGDALSSLLYKHWGDEIGGASGGLYDLSTDVAKRAAVAADMQPVVKPVNLKSVLGKVTGQSDASWNPMKLESPTDWAPFAAGAEINRMAESQPRITGWLKSMAEGYDPAVAADMARESQFRYSPKSFTNFERKVMKRLVPFYSFAKQSAASTAKELAERPGGPLGQFVKAEGQLSDASGDFVPDYIKQGLSVPIPSDMPLLGAGEGGDPRFLTGFGLMHETPFGYLGGGPSGVALAGLSNLNPLLKGAIETATGVSTFQRGPGGARELSEQDPLIGRLMSNVYDTATGERTKEPPRLPQLLENVVSNSPVSALLSMSRTLADPRKNWTAKALNTLTGARVTDVPEKTTEGITGRLLTQMMKEAGGRSFENVYFSKQQKAEASPDQLQAMLRLEAFKNMLAKRGRARAKAALAAP